MAKNDVKIVSQGGADSVVTRTYRVDDRTTSGLTVTIKPGEPVKQSADGGNFVIPILTGDPEIGTDMMIGIAASESTETSTADGTVEVHMVIPGVTVMRAKATTAANIDTDDKLEALLNDCVTFDDTALTYTVDEDEGNDNNGHGLIIIGGDIEAGTLDFVLKSGASQAGAAL